MCAEVRFWARLGAIVVLSWAARGPFALAKIVNYDNHPDLTKAKEYDLTVEIKSFYRADGSFDRGRYESYLAGANRKLAEQHYLAYLQDVNESFQRAAVYARLGELFCGATSPRVATTIDKDKARVYFRKALEAETTARNLVHEAIGRMAVDPRTTLWSEARAVRHLTVLAERFPDASVARRARAELARIARRGG